MFLTNTMCVIPQYVFNKKDPIVLGVEVLEGTLRLNCPLCVPSLNIDIGRVTRIESNHKEVQFAKKSTQVPPTPL
jgi:translation initiation factor 5B